MKVVFDIGKPTPAKLNALLEALTQLNYQKLGIGTFPELYDSGVKYKVEDRSIGYPQGAEHFDTADKVYAKGHADCDKLAAWRAAELRRRGYPAKAVAYRSGARRFHAVVELPGGAIEDPSKKLGMGKRSKRGRR